MQEHTIPVGHLVFPILLPFAERVFLQHAVSLDDEFRSCGLEGYTTFDADDGITHITVTTDGIAGANLLNLLDGFDLIIKMLIIDSHDFSLLEGNLQFAFFLLSDMLQIGIFWKTLRRVENLSATDARSPDTYVIRILQFRKVSIETVGIQIVDLFLT